MEVSKLPTYTLDVHEVQLQYSCTVHVYWFSSGLSSFGRLCNKSFFWKIRGFLTRLFSTKLYKAFKYFVNTPTLIIIVSDVYKISWFLMRAAFPNTPPHHNTTQPHPLLLISLMYYSAKKFDYESLMVKVVE